ncbi:MAG: TlpA disulfide reductase family protein [Chitinophagaceae bacterium]
MKRVFFLLGILVSVAGAFAQSSKFTLTGDVSALKAPAEWVYISYYLGDRRVSDSAPVRQNKYILGGNVSEPVLAKLHVKYKSNGEAQPIPANSRRDYAAVFLQPGSIKVSSVDSFANITVAGSKADEEYRMLEEIAKPYNDRLDELYRQFPVARKNKETALMAELEKQIDSLNASANDNIYGAYVKKNPTSLLAMYAFKNWAGYEIDAEKAEPVFKTLPATARNTISGKEMQEKITIAKKTGIGQVAMDFTQNDTLGQPLALHSLRGKYLLVDFWASWCGPCRQENPNLVNVFNQFKEKGFQVLSISLDKPGAKERWLQAIHDDRLAWTHVSDLQFWNNAVARQYGIQAIPQNLLLDPNGKIIAKNLRGEALEKKLAAIYAN